MLLDHSKFSRIYTYHFSLVRYLERYNCMHASRDATVTITGNRYELVTIYR